VVFSKKYSNSSIYWLNTDSSLPWESSTSPPNVLNLLILTLRADLKISKMIGGTIRAIAQMPINLKIEVKNTKSAFVKAGNILSLYTKHIAKKNTVSCNIP